MAHSIWGPDGADRTSHGNHERPLLLRDRKVLYAPTARTRNTAWPGKPRFDRPRRKCVTRPVLGSVPHLVLLPVLGSVPSVPDIKQVLTAAGSWVGAPTFRLLGRCPLSGSWVGAQCARCRASAQDRRYVGRCLSIPALGPMPVARWGYLRRDANGIATTACNKHANNKIRTQAKPDKLLGQLPNGPGGTEPLNRTEPKQHTTA